MVAKAKRGVISAQDRLAGLFEPDVLLPAQFFAAFRRMGGLDRERLLMLAVLEDAVDCFQKYAFAKDPRGRQLFAEAAEWVDSFDKGWLFSFENICDTLEIAPGYVRRGLSAWRERQRTLDDMPGAIPSLAGEGSIVAEERNGSFRKESA